MASSNLPMTDPKGNEVNSPQRSDEQPLAHSTDLLRVVLPKMTKHADGYDPISYAVWFEYVRGSVPELRRDVDVLVGDDRRLLPAETRKLYDDHLRDRSEAALVDARTQIVAMLSRVIATIDTAQADAGQFRIALASFDGVLAKPTSNDDLARALVDLAADTDQMRTSISTMSGELHSNRAEVERLTDELARLREDVLTDPLTGLSNRRGLDLALAELKRAVDAGDESFALVLIDIDHFKQVNDVHGHQAGDRVIQQVGNAMRSCVRGSDTCARHGGEEFALLLPATAAGGAKTVMEHVRNAIRRTQVTFPKTSSPGKPVTVSAGIAGFIAGESIDDCMRRADEALYTSKRDGRDRITLAAV